MKSQHKIYLFSFILIFISLSMVIYKVNFLGFPLFSQETKSVWNIEAKVTFDAQGDDVSISMVLPQEQTGLIIVNEESSSSNYGYTTSTLNNIKRGNWAKREVKGKETLYYSVDLIKDEQTLISKKEYNYKFAEIDIKKSQLQSAEAVLKNIYQRSANSLSFSALLVKEFNEESTSQSINMIKNDFMKSPLEKREAFVRMLSYNNFQVRPVDIIRLEDGKRNIKIEPMFEVLYKNTWRLFDIQKGEIDRTNDIFVWQSGSLSLLDAEGVQKSRVRFSVTENVISARQAVLTKDMKNQNALLDFSLFILPNASQNAFKLLLLVPLGALVVVILRVLVGLKTSGTFMPILLAMAFMQTQLLPGILMFILVVSIGLFVRFYLSYLNLLLVARISSVVIVVVAIMSFVAILAQKLDLEYATSITFFPMIILAWTIERMSIIWEEDGPKEVLEQGTGSLIVAVLAYFTMTNETLSFITFNFPEVLWAVLGVIILLGRYNGYRLSELYRFKSMDT